MNRPHPPLPPAPSVSVIMTAYNAQDYVAEALESVLGQSLADFELLVVDDGSTDDTRGIIERYARLDGRIAVIRLDRNGGVAHAKNLALQRARAPFVAICDADDRQLPHRLAAQATALRENPRRVMVGCRVQPFGDQASPHGAWAPVADSLVRARILFQIPYGDAANMFRRELVQRHGLRYPTGAVWEDWLFQARALRYGDIHVLPEVLLHYRRHAAQETGTDRRTNARLRTKATMRQVLGEAGIACSPQELELHHAISPNPFGPLTDPDYLLRHQDQIAIRAKAWLRRLAQEVARSCWTSPEAIETMAEEIMQRLEENMRGARIASAV